MSPAVFKSSDESGFLIPFFFFDLSLSSGVRVTFHESVREADVYIITTASSMETGTNGALMEWVFRFSLLEDGTPLSRC